MKVKIPFILAAMSVLAGCASMSEEDCANANWAALGFQDGVDGRPITKFAERTEQCQAYGILSDQARYLEGRTRGLEAYCTPARGLAEGKQGAGYQNVCPAELEFSFLEGYELGREFYYAEREYQRAIDAYEDNLADLNRRVRQLNDRIGKYNNSEDEEEREKLAGEIEALRRIIDKLRNDSFYLRDRLAREERYFREFLFRYEQRERAFINRYGIAY